MPSVDYTAIRQACQPVRRVVDPCPMVRLCPPLSACPSMTIEQDMDADNRATWPAVDPEDVPSHRSAGYPPIYFAAGDPVVRLPDRDLGPGGECPTHPSRCKRCNGVGAHGDTVGGEAGVICDVCHGDGTSFCQWCAGSGIILDPLERECPRCEGDGRAFADVREVCNRCHGSGRVRATSRERCRCARFSVTNEDDLPLGYIDAARPLQWVPGEGIWLVLRDCPHCHGTGERDVPEDYMFDDPRQPAATTDT